MWQLLAIALGTLASEDLACVGAGVLVAEGRLHFAPAVVASFTGIVIGDFALFAAGRWLGRLVLRRLPQASVDRATEWLTRRGAAVILVSRFTPGLRLPTYVAAGVMGVPATTAALWFAIAAALWTPLLVGAAAVFGAPVADHLFILTLVALALLLLIRAHDRAFRRRIHGFFHRKIHWEFWPSWAIYLPLLPYLIYLACKHRSITLFTAANPGIPSGGLGGESKWAILQQLGRVGSLVARSELVVGQYTGTFPVVFKPDIGERGRGVAIIRCEADARRYLAAAEGAVIAQEYVGGVEFGVFYCCGRIVSITEKRLPEIVGDGHSSIEELILNDPRAFCLAKTYLTVLGRDPATAPAAGERIRLTEIGSHCRGAIFLDATHLKTTTLEQAIDRVSQAHPGFFFGRYDIRAESTDAFQQGRFKVLELNGVGAEATHIYDPSIGIREAYRVMRSQWRMAFEIGAMNRALGARVMGIRELLRYLRQGRAQQRPKAIRQRSSARRAA